jgi:hypothetical protein
MVAGYPPPFTCAFLVHGGHEIAQLTIPETLANLRDSSIDLDTILVVDGASDESVQRWLQSAKAWDIDEVRVRSRRRHRASGDQANNSHLHCTSAKGDYFLTFEEDVFLSRVDVSVDCLEYFKRVFTARSDLSVLFRMDDVDCWAEELIVLQRGDEPEMVDLVSRLSSHFTARRVASWPKVESHVRGFTLFDDGETWCNFEDALSAVLKIMGGIGFLREAPFRVFHCDEKISPGSSHYRRDTPTKVGVFHTRMHQILAERLAVGRL